MTDTGSLALPVYAAALWRAARRHAGPLSVAALLAAAGVIFTAAFADPVFRSDAVITTLFDDDDGSALGAGFFPARQLNPSGLNLLVSSPRGQLFPLILGSRRVSRAVLNARYRYQIDGAPGVTDLYDYLGINNRDAAEVVLKTRLAGFYLDRNTGATRISVTTRSPELSRQIVERYVAALEKTLNELREQRIRLELSVIEGKLVAAKDELLRREASLRSLRARNREYASLHDPDVYLRQLQLERDIRLSETIMLALKIQYERTMSRLLDRQGRLTVVTPPVTATTYWQPRWGQTVLMALLCAVLVAVAAAAVLAAADADPCRRRRWRTLFRVVAGDFRRIRRIPRRIVNAGASR